MSCELQTDVHLLLTRYRRYLILPLLLFKVNQTSAYAVLLILFLFFRSPDRVFKDQTRSEDITSPADGTILDIKRHDNGNIVISTFLSVFDVHVQYSPTNGTIVSQQYVKGQFNPAYLMEKSQYNERLKSDILTSNGKIISVIQIAGQIANRIDSYVKPGSLVRKGCRLGMIMFGSRVDIIVQEKDFTLAKDVHIGTYVFAGHTTLFTAK